jgi:hypothetical protein
MQSKEELEQPTYGEMATALASYVYVRCHMHAGYFGFSHCGENGWDVAPDILDRLNVMECDPQYTYFRIHWKPGEQLPIWRNGNEPRRAEFAIALVWAVRWNIGTEWIDGRRVDKPAIDIAPVEPPKNTMWLIAKCLQQMGLGDGVEQGFFMLNERGEAVPDYWHYWTPENRRRHTLKRVPSRRQRRELKLQGVIDPTRPRYL